MLLEANGKSENMKFNARFRTISENMFENWIKLNLKCLYNSYLMDLAITVEHLWIFPQK